MAGVHEELERLREVERRLTAITANAPDFILQFDRSGTISYMNRPALGHTLEQMLGTDVRKWMEPKFHEAFTHAVEVVFETGKLSSYESVGSVTGRHYVNRVSPVLVEGEVTSAVLITHDITDTRLLEEHAREAEKRYRALVEGAFEGLVLSIDRVALYGNHAVAEMFGYELQEIEGIAASKMATPESAALIAKNVAAGIETPYEVTCVRKDGSTFPVELLGRNTVYQGKRARITGLRDLTERKRLEAEQTRREDRVRHAQKLETLGILAGGIAHDFNNLLTIIVANADMARRAAGRPELVARSLKQIHEAVLRGGELTNQLLVYAGRGERNRAPVSLSRVVNDAMELLRVSISKKADLRCELADALPAVDADVGQLRQIVMNLLINASESLGDESGSILVSTGIVQADALYLAGTLADEATQPGEFAYLDVEDSGVGIDPHAVRRLFDPFFTTKAGGRGLGLAAVLGIVRAHGGAISVDSAPGRGTRFRVLLPVSGAVLSEDAGPVEIADAGGVISGRVLLVEDEPAIARVAHEILESAGCELRVASDGEQALAIFNELHETLDLVVLDLTMPKKNGLEVLREIRGLNRDIPVLLTSGHAALSYKKLLDEDPKTHFLSKPYTVDALLERLRATLRS